MPENVDVSVKEISGVTLINVDELSKITDKKKNIYNIFRGS